MHSAGAGVIGWMLSVKEISPQETAETFWCSAARINKYFFRKLYPVVHHNIAEEVDIDAASHMTAHTTRLQLALNFSFFPFNLAMHFTM